MASFQSFATTGSNVVVDADERTITISNEVVEIDGVLDAPTGGWDGWTIVCQSSGGFRSTSGASGTLGGGVHSLKIVEKTNGHRFGGDNFSGSNGDDARFAGDATNVLKYHNILWIVETGDRSDFDWGRGTSTDGSAGQKVELSGVNLIQLTETGQTAHFNHYSGQSSIKVHPEVGYGLRIENRTNGHAIEFSTAIQTGAVVEGLVVANVTATNNDGDPAGSSARVAVRLENVPLNGTMTFSNLNTPNITDVNGGSNSGSKTLVLIDPVGLPTITDNWGRHVNIEVRRNVPFTFTGMEVPAGTRMYAQNQITGGESTNGVVSGASDTIEVQTQRTLNNTATTWTNYNQYKFRMPSLAFRKYALETTQTIGNVPATITADLEPDNFPDGTAISSITFPAGNNVPDTLSEVIRLIKQYEVDNPFHDSYPAGPLIYIDGTAVKLNDDYRLTLGSTNATPGFNIGQSGGHDLVGIKTAATIDASNGLNTLEASGTGETITTTSVAEGDGVFFRDSTGQRSVISVTNSMGASALFSLVKASDGTTAGSGTIPTTGGTFSIGTKGLGSGYKLVAKRPGYDYFTADVDLTGGGLREISAPAPRLIVQPDGSASYQSSVSVPDTLTIAVSHSGTTPASRVECGNDTFTARQVFKAWEDEIATADGAAYMGLGGAQITYTLSALKGNEIVLGAHTKVKRKATTDVNATIRATLYAPDDAPVDGVNGDVQTIEGLDIPAVATEIWSSSTRTLTSGGGGGGGFTSDDRTKLEAIKTTTDALDIPSASEVADEVWSRRFLSTKLIPSSVDSGSIVFDADDRVLVPNLTAVRITNLGGYTGPNTTDTYIVADDGAGRRPLYRTRDEALANQIGDRIDFTGAGTAGLIRVDVLSPVAIEMTYDIHDNTSEIPQDVWLYATRELTNTSSLATSVANGVWTRSTRTLSNTDNIWSNSNALTNAGISSAVWAETDRTLTAADNITADIADAVWDEEITIIGSASATITPELTINQNISLSSSDAVGITNGQVVRVSNTGGLTGWQTGVDYYARIGGTILNLYETEAQALAGGNDGIVYSGGFDTTRTVTLTTTRTSVTRNLGQARDVIEAILLDTEAVLPAPTAEQITTAVWSADDRTITGGADAPSESEIATAVSNIAVESGLTLKQAMQILTAIMAGRLSIDSNGSTYTYSRLDASQTPVIRSDTAEDGRGAPTRDPT